MRYSKKRGVLTTWYHIEKMEISLLKLLRYAHAGCLQAIHAGDESTSMYDLDTILDLLEEEKRETEFREEMMKEKEMRKKQGR